MNTEVEKAAKLPVATKPVEQLDETGEELRGLAVELRDAGAVAVEKYREIVLFVRNNYDNTRRKDHKKVLEILRGVLPDYLCSKIKTVAFADRVTFVDYIKGNIGFNATLIKARANDPEARQGRNGHKAKRSNTQRLYNEAVRLVDHSPDTRLIVRKVKGWTLLLWNPDCPQSLAAAVKAAESIAKDQEALAA